MSRVCIFDVNETMLDLRALDPHFESAFGDENGVKTGISKVLSHLQRHGYLERAGFSKVMQSHIMLTATQRDSQTLINLRSVPNATTIKMNKTTPKIICA